MLCPGVGQNISISIDKEGIDISLKAAISICISIGISIGINMCLNVDLVVVDTVIIDDL